jgi:hypothetical protein
MNQIKENLHDLVDEYILIAKTLQAFSGYFLSGKNYDEKFCINFNKNLEKYKRLGSQIKLQYEKEEDPISAMLEILRAMNPYSEEENIKSMLETELKNG